MSGPGPHAHGRGTRRPARRPAGIEASPYLPAVGSTAPGGGEPQRPPAALDCAADHHWLHRPRGAAASVPWACRFCSYTEPFLGRIPPGWTR